MKKQSPQTISVCVSPQHVLLLDELGEELVRQAEPVSRSGLVRMALNTGLAALAERIRKRDPNSDDGQGPGTPDGAGVSAAAA